MTSISVVICCHNSSSRLPETLSHLADQKVDPDLWWEILIVDNASTDDTAMVAQNFAARHPKLEVRVIPEPRLGQTYARWRGSEEARGEVVLFVDDDNWLASNYVLLVAETMHQHPEAAALGGMSTAVFEEEPPAWMERHSRWYAVSGAPKDHECFREVDSLWGAGTAYRRDTLQSLAGRGLRLAGRQGASLTAGEDMELCELMRRNGEKMFCHPDLRFQHYLPARRVQWSYLRRLHRAAGEVGLQLDVYRLNGPDSPGPTWLLHSWHAQMINVFLRLLRHPGILRRASKQLLEDDDRVLYVERYLGRMTALKRNYKGFRKMMQSGPAR